MIKIRSLRWLDAKLASIIEEVHLYVKYI
jgi:hypothetical protein